MLDSKHLDLKAMRTAGGNRSLLCPMERFAGGRRVSGCKGIDCCGSGVLLTGEASAFELA